MTPVTAVLLCLGSGSRMRPLSQATAKCHIEFCLRPLIEYTIDQLLRHGVRDIVLVANEGDTEADRYVGSGAPVSRVVVLRRGPGFGSAGVLREVSGDLRRRGWNPEAPLLVVYADSLLEIDFTRLVESHEHNRMAGGWLTIGCHQPDDLLPPGQSHSPYGILSFDRGGRLSRFREKPPADDIFSPFVSAGVFVLDWSSIEGAVPADGPSDLSRDVIETLVSAGAPPVFAFDIAPGYRYDIGSPAEYLMRQQAALEGRIRLDGFPASSGELRTTPGGAVVLVGRDSEIADDVAFRGASVIGHRAVIGRGCVIDNSAVLQDARIDEAVSLSRTVVGAGARVGPGLRLGNGSVIGGHSVLRPG